MKDKEVKGSCRSNKRHYIDALAIEAETAARNKDHQKMKGDYGTSQDKRVKTTDGRTLKWERER